MSKYEPLQRHLTCLQVRVWRASFDDVEQVLGFALPKSAYRYPAWWSNDTTGHVQSNAWLDAGWKTENVDIEGRAVTFSVGDRDVLKAGGSGAGANGSIELFGALKGTVRVQVDWDLTEPTGETWSASDGRLGE